MARKLEIKLENQEACIKKCSVKNCQKELSEYDQVKIGTQAFCSTCAVLYFKGMLGVSTDDDIND